jgi:hypothetical protein
VRFLAAKCQEEFAMRWFSSDSCVDDDELFEQQIIEEKYEQPNTGGKRFVVTAPPPPISVNEFNLLKKGVQVTMDSNAVKGKYVVGDFLVNIYKSGGMGSLVKDLQMAYGAVNFAGTMQGFDNSSGWDSLLRTYQTQIEHNPKYKIKELIKGGQGEKKIPIWCNVTAGMALKTLQAQVKKLQKACLVDVVELNLGAQNHFITVVKPRLTPTFNSSNFVVDMWGALEERWLGNNLNRSVIWTPNEITKRYTSKVKKIYHLMVTTKGNIVKFEKTRKLIQKTSGEGIQSKLKKTDHNLW